MNSHLDCTRLLFAVAVRKLKCITFKLKGAIIMKANMIRSLLVIFICTLSINICWSQEITNHKSSARRVEILNTEVREIISSETNRQYFAYVHLPQGYYESDKKYPVLYLTDAEEFSFGMYTSIFLVLRLDNEIGDIILVGISNGGNLYEHFSRRRRDYTPTKDEDYPGSGEAAEHLRFIKEDLIQKIDREYRTDPSNRGIWGSSYGGLFAIYAMLNSPETFQNYIIASPSMWWDGRTMLNDVKAFVEVEQELTANIYTALGEQETTRMRYGWEQFNELLEDRSYKDLKLTRELLQDETHVSMMPTAFTRGLKSLYGRTSVAFLLETVIKEKGVDGALDYFYDLKQSNPEDYDFREETINSAGYKYLRANKIKDAISIFKLNIKLYPESSNVYDSLGEAYEKNKELENAAKYFEMAYKKAIGCSAKRKAYYKKNLDNVLKILKSK